ncbi:MAG: hypothetical protein KF847_03675 [Pirellulales bacterium]|nr:hypothetical protein [Pirellulales bacterium]
MVCQPRTRTYGAQRRRGLVIAVLVAGAVTAARAEEPQAPQPDARAYYLGEVDSATLEARIRAATGGRPVQATLDARNNRLVVRGDERLHAAVAGALRDLAQAAPAPANPPVRVAQLDARQPASPPPANGAPAAAPASAAPEAKSAAQSATLRLTQISAEDFHARLQTTFNRPLPLLSEPRSQWLRFAIELPSEPAVMAAVDRQTGTVRLDGRPEQLAAWRRIVEALDAPNDPQANPAYVAVGPRAAPQVRQSVAMLLAQNTTGGAGQAPSADAEGAAALTNLAGALLGPVQVENIEGTDIFIIRGNPRDTEKVREVIRQIEAMSQVEPPKVAVVSLKNADGVAMAALLNRAFGPPTTGPTLASYYGTPLVLPLSNPNAVFVAAAPLTFDRVMEVIRELDQQQTEAGSQFEIFRLERASAEDIENVLEDLLALDDDETATLGVKALVFADARSNSVLVRAAPRAMEEARRLIRELDQVSAASAVLKVFPVENGDAVALVDTLESLFGAVDQGDNAQAGVFQLRLSVDERTNSIIAAGSQEELLVVETILLRLDSEEARQRRNQVYKLKNASAEDVALSLQQWLQQERDVRETGPGVVSPFTQLEREVVVVPDIGSNSLIVSATPRYYDEIARIIEQLDEQAPMVLIQVLIGEVRLGDADEFGVELGLQDSALFDRSLLGDISNITTTTQTTSAGGAVTSVTQQSIQNASLNPGYNFGNPQQGIPNSGSDRSLATSGIVAAQGLSNFAVNRLNPDLGFGGLVLSASSESVSMLLRALQESRRLEVLSRPQIMALNNQIGRAFVGEIVPFVTGQTVPVVGSFPINQITREPVGLRLEVRPRISPDGLVVMEVFAEKSELGRIADGVPVGFAQNGDPINVPRVNATQAQTVVSAVSGQTVVLSGLLTKRDEAIHRRVPLLADIPLLGNLFRYDLSTTRRTELLIILTPHIVRSRYESEMLKQTESARMSWCLSDVVDMHGPAGLRSRLDPLGAAEAQAVYPGMPGATDGFVAPELAPQPDEYVVPQEQMPPPR